VFDHQIPDTHPSLLHALLMSTSDISQNHTSDDVNSTKEKKEKKGGKMGTRREWWIMDDRHDLDDEGFAVLVDGLIDGWID